MESNRLPSQVIKPARSDAAVVKENDAESLNRGKRMMGVLLGTLQRFKSDTAAASEAAGRRRQIEEKLAARLAEEKATLLAVLEKEQTEKRQRTEASRLERQALFEKECMERQKRHSRTLASFFKTKSQPSVFYLPKQLDESMKFELDSQMQPTEMDASDDVAPIVASTDPIVIMEDV